MEGRIFRAVVPSSNRHYLHSSSDSAVEYRRIELKGCRRPTAERNTVFMLLAFVGLLSLGRAAQADTLMYSPGLNTLGGYFFTPEEAAQVDAVAWEFTTNGVCGVENYRYVWFNIDYSNPTRPDGCSYRVVGHCVTDVSDPEYNRYPPLPSPGWMRCDCAPGETWNTETNRCEAPAQYFVVAQAEIQSGNDDSCEVSFVGDPINPTNGSVVKTEGDCSAGSGGGSLSYRRFYSSTNDSAGSLGVGWRGSFSRRINPNTILASVAAHDLSNPDHSSLYSDPASACANGFAEIRSRVASWADATTVYEDELCKVVKNERVVALIPIRKSGGIPMVSPTPKTFDVIRDDGQALRFWNQDGALRSSAGVTLRLTQTPSGFEIRDSNDTVERYNTDGVLLSITTRAGVVQTISYDALNRLISVTDSFGHQLIFNYDSQNRLISVTRR